VLESVGEAVAVAPGVLVLPVGDAAGDEDAGDDEGDAEADGEAGAVPDGLVCGDGDAAVVTDGAGHAEGDTEQRAAGLAGNVPDPLPAGGVGEARVMAAVLVTLEPRVPPHAENLHFC
jgi:hypothetical protein